MIEGGTTTLVTYTYDVDTPGGVSGSHNNRLLSSRTFTGGVLSAGEEGIRVCTGKDLYRIIRIKPENGRNMTAGEWVRGHPLPPDARFG